MTGSHFVSGFLDSSGVRVVGRNATAVLRSRLVSRDSRRISLKRQHDQVVHRSNEILRSVGTDVQVDASRVDFWLGYLEPLFGTFYASFEIAYR